MNGHGGTTAVGDSADDSMNGERSAGNGGVGSDEATLALGALAVLGGVVIAAGFE